jgi:hypothetical protein
MSEQRGTNGDSFSPANFLHIRDERQYRHHHTSRVRSHSKKKAGWCFLLTRRRNSQWRSRYHQALRCFVAEAPVVGVADFFLFWSSFSRVVEDGFSIALPGLRHLRASWFHCSQERGEASRSIVIQTNSASVGDEKRRRCARRWN